MDFSHFIITQFNLRNFPLSNNNDYQSWLEWTRKRVDLFSEFCLPSVINQTRKSFKWLLYFDSETPKEFSDFIQKLNTYEFIIVCYCSGMNDFNNNYINEVKKRTGTAEWIVTTRIDNDDCLNKQAVEIIHNNFEKKSGFLISLASGYLLNTNDLTLSHYYYPMSPFISLIEKNNDEIKGIFQRGHTKWDSLRLFVLKEIWLEYFDKKSRKSRFILKEPLWIQTVHGENVSNNFHRGLPVINNKDLSGFSLYYSSNGLPFKTITKYFNYVLWKRYVKCLIIKYLIKK
jgi:hypothetical protein